MVSTKDIIIEAGIKAVSKNAAFTLEEVAVLANVSRRTLHRYFIGRDDLLEHCKEKILLTCNTAMTTAYNSTNEPTIQLEAMLYAAIETGVKSSFIKKLYERSTYNNVLQSGEFHGDDVKSKWYKLIIGLQSEDKVNRDLTAAWIFNLFGGIIDTAIMAAESGDVAQNDIKSFAWYSFKNGIGLKDI